MPSAWNCSRVGGLRHQLGHEAAFGADRHDHRVLDLLRLHQPEDLGAEILRPVGPADAAARHLAEAHMHAFDARRIDENFVERARQRQVGDLAALELDRDQRLGLAVFVGLIEIGADRRLHGVDEVAQDAVFVEALDFLQFLFDARGDFFLLLRRALARRRGADRSGHGTARRRRRRCRHASPASPTCSPANRARAPGAGSATACGSAPRRARPARRPA